MSKHTGTIKWYEPTKGFGFIRSEADGQEYFVHHSGLLTKRDNPPQKGERVSFEIVAGDRGPKAANVQRSL